MRREAVSVPSNIVKGCARDSQLAAGRYTLNFGGNPRNQTMTGQHGFQATLRTVPVPAAVWLFGSGLARLLGLARRRMAV
jgi:hypothetical protein